MKKTLDLVQGWVNSGPPQRFQ